MFQTALANRKLRWGLAALVILATVAALLAVRPLTAWRRIQSARHLLKQRDFENAYQSLKEAEELAPQNAEVQFLLARTRRRSGMLNLVQPHLQRARALGCDEIRLQREWWLTLAQAGRLAEAEPHLPHLLQHPGDDGAEICEAYFHGYRANLRFDKANMLLDVWAADIPDDPEPYFLRGLCAEMLSDYRRAIEEYRTGLEMAPGRTEYRRRLASALQAVHQPEEAALHFRHCLRESPDNLAAEVGLGACLQELGHDDEAIRCFRRVIRREPQNVEARIGLGKLMLMQRNAEEALRWLRPLVDEWPGNAEAQYALAQALNLAGQTAEAEKHLAAYRESFRQLERLEELFDEIGSDADNVQKRFEIGKLLITYHSRENGEAWLKSVLQLDPRHREANLALAEHYTNCGDEQQAAIHRRLAADAVPVESQPP